MSTPAAVAVLVVSTALGALLDAARGGTLGLSLGFLAGCVLAALLVRRRGLLAVCVAPPLAFAGVLAAVTVATAPGALTARALALGTETVVLFPVLATGTGAAVVVAVVRAVGERPAGTRARR